MSDNQNLPNVHPEPFSVSPAATVHGNKALKNGDSFGVFDTSGDILMNENSSQGFYNLDTRHLSMWGLLLGGSPPILLNSSISDDNVTLTCDMSNATMSGEHDGHLIHILRSRFLWKGVMHERIQLQDFSGHEHQINLKILFDADFKDLFEIRGMPRTGKGLMISPIITHDTVILKYLGLDGKLRITRIQFENPPCLLSANCATFKPILPAHGRISIFAEISCTEEVMDKPVHSKFLSHLLKARKQQRNYIMNATRIVSSNEIFDKTIRRAFSDLYMLVTDKPSGPYPYAGIPWFSTAFGRDAIITSLMTLWLDPEIARGTLCYLAQHQSIKTDAASDATPGKILHEIRNGEMAETGEVPFKHYYGSIDSTPLFVVLAGAYLERTGDIKTIRELWPNICAALHWIENYGDLDGDGFVEYYRMTDNGLANQSWKDSWDSISHKDGSIAQGPIAVCEVQGYVFGAWKAAAEISQSLNLESNKYLKKAQDLKENFQRSFWCKEIGTYVIALDGNKKQCKIRSSNPGSLMLTGLIDYQNAQKMVTGLMGSDFSSGWGIRTLAIGEERYNPMSYHNGSIWPHDNAMIAMGLGKYGFKQEAMKILEGMFAAAQNFDMHRLPELFCGFRRVGGRSPTLYPVACSPQAWASAALPAMLYACLGITFDIKNNILIFNHPYMPSFLKKITLFNLRIGQGKISVSLKGIGSSVSVNVISKPKDIKINIIC